MIKRITVAVVLVLMLALPAAPAMGATVALDSAYCTNASKLNGTWSGSTCTIASGRSGQVPATDQLEIAVLQKVMFVMKDGQIFRHDK